LGPVKINMIISETTTGRELKEMRSFCGERGLDLQTIKLFSLYDRDEGAGLPFSFDRPMPCSSCDKIRLTADGFFKPCLFSDSEIKADLDDIEKSIREAVGAKPERGTACVNRRMGEIGG
jgi:cyclic pyranopterin phosphate synthase